MRRAALVVLSIGGVVVGLIGGLAGTAAADTFGGFGGREDGYLVGRDRICTPLAVDKGVATGAPSCAKATAAEVAHLSVKTPTAIRGREASHTATAKGRTLELAAKDQVIVTWQSPDPISKVVAVYLSTYGNVAAVEYTVRRAGRDVTEVVAFDLRVAGAAATTDDKAPEVAAPKTEAAPPATPALKKALKAARKARGKAALKAWQKVLALDAEHSEARYGLAVAHARTKKKELALAELETLAASTRTDAVEYLVKARFDKAFAAVRADARFRAAVGLDQEKAGFYVRLMGHGGAWEQAETACDQPGVALRLEQARTFRLTITTNCGGERWETVFKGRWEAAEPKLTLLMPAKKRGAPEESFECAVEREGDEDAIRCVVDQDLSFVVRPVRR